VFDYQDRYPEARKDLSRWLAEGKIQRKETIVKGGLGKAEEALTQLYKGVNTGTYILAHLSSISSELTRCRKTTCRSGPGGGIHECFKIVTSIESRLCSPSLMERYLHDLNVTRMFQQSSSNLQINAS
jgi:hypothetical protein